MELEEIHGVVGYRIGGKTGTSEDGVNTGKYVTSFIGVAPISDPQVAVLITLYNPTGEGGHQGGGVAAPIGAQVFGEILPYLEIKKDNETEVETIEDVTVPNLIGLSINEATNILKNNELQLIINDKQEESSDELDKDGIIIKQQTPKEGVVIKKGKNVYIDY